MAKLGEFSRTVSYYRLVDARTRDFVDPINWWRLLHNNADRPIERMVQGTMLTGDVQAIDVPPEYRELVNAVPEGIDVPGSAETTYGVVFSKDKDHVPNQRNAAGEQRPVGVDHGFTPVDNTFFWFLPVGNSVGVLQESVSSSGPRRFADWLTGFMKERGFFRDDPEFYWDVMPIVDEERGDALRQARGFKAVTLASTTDGHGALPTGLGGLLSDPFKRQLGTSYRIEVSIRATRSSPTYDNDVDALQQWVVETFGQLTGLSANAADTDKLRVEAVAAPGDDVPTGEVDLLRHRLTRKRQVLMRTNDAGIQAIGATSALSAIMEAFALDAEDLARLV